jgi:integrase
LDLILRPWLDTHPGTPFTFFHAKPSHDIECGYDQLTKDQASYYFKRLLKDSKWSVVKGWHCLRHSFISNCASKGIDQRMIDEWVGHTTEEMRRRYRHLFPSTQQDAMKQLFQ